MNQKENLKTHNLVKIDNKIFWCHKCGINIHLVNDTDTDTDIEIDNILYFTVDDKKSYSKIPECKE